MSFTLLKKGGSEKIHGSGGGDWGHTGRVCTPGHLRASSISPSGRERGRGPRDRSPTQCVRESGPHERLRVDTPFAET